MNRVLHLIVCLLGFAAATRAQGTYWEETPAPYGGDGTLTRTENGILYAQSNEIQNWIYRSDDDGEHWQKLPHEGPYVIGSTGRFYKKDGTLWYWSDNEGEIWTVFVNANLVNKLLELPGGVLVGYNSDYFYRSVDAGLTWEQTSDYLQQDDRNLQNMRITPFGGLLAEATAFAGDSTRFFYRSTDEGQSWQRLELPYGFSRLFIAPSGTLFANTGDAMYRSVDDGEHFDFVDSLKIGKEQMTALASGRLLAIASQQLYFSDDDGLNWLPLNVKFDQWLFQPIPPLDDGSIFSTILGTLFKSEDGGEDWQLPSDGMRQGNILSMRVLSDSVYFASTQAGLWKTNDGGEHWSCLLKNKTYQNEGSFEVVSTGGIVAVQDDRLFWSATGDAPFDDITPADDLSTSVNKVYVNPFNNHLFINTLEGLARSENYGQQWIVPDPGFYLSALGFHPSGRLVGVRNNSNIVISDNNGDSWITVPVVPVLALGSIMIAPDGTAYVVAILNNNTVVFLKSENAGDSWAQVAGDIGNIQIWTGKLLDVAANGHIFRNDGNKNLFRSVNGGVTWQSMPDIPNNPNDLPLTVNIYISPLQHLYVNTQGLGNYRTVAPVSLGAYINGHVRRDADAECSTPDAQDPLRNWIVGAEGGYDYYTVTDVDGGYVFFVDTGSYTVSAHPPSPLIWALCDSTSMVSADSLFATDTVDFAASAIVDCPLMSVDVVIPLLRRCFDNTVFIEYCNIGSEQADSAYMDVMLDPYLSFVSSGQLYDDLGNNTYRFYLGNVESGECGQYSLVAKVNCDSTVLGQTHCVVAHGFPDTLCSQVPNWSGAEIVARATCQDTSVIFELHNNGPAISQPLDYIIIEDDVVLMQGNKTYTPDESLALDVPANGHTWRIESKQEPGHPFSSIALAFSEGCGGFATLGFINQFSVDAFTPSWDQECVQNTGSFDPNDKQGFPQGYSAEHFIDPGQEIEYLIRFQNTGTDTAFTVVIIDTLSAWLDPASLRPGASSHPYTWNLSGQGVIRFSFENILLPDSNVNEAASHGFVGFRIAQRSGVPIGAQIFNKADIYFDFNEPVVTNETWHTVGVKSSVGTHGPHEKGRQPLVTVAPNPMAETALFELNVGSFRGHRLTLLDAFGRQIREVELNGRQFLFRREALPSGTYFYRLEDAKGNWQDGGVLILK
ncbi:MAG: hypothetical protein R2791_16545 [Saprospiraceae bacterium]